MVVARVRGRTSGVRAGEGRQLGRERDFGVGIADEGDSGTAR